MWSRSAYGREDPFVKASTYYVDDVLLPRAEAHCACGSVSALKLLPDGSFQCQRCQLVARLKERFGSEDIDTFLQLIRPVDLNHVEVS